MNKTFYLIRHGQKEKIPDDPGLSAVGVEQAKATGKYLQQFPIMRLITSPMLRSRQTAEHISGKLHLPVEVSEELKERMNWGDQPGQSYESFLPLWERANIERDWVPPIGDSSRAAGQRMLAVMQGLINTEATHIALVSHGGIITDFLRNVFEANLLDSLMPGFENDLDNVVKEASITQIEVDNTKQSSFHLVKLASVEHLIRSATDQT